MVAVPLVMLFTARQTVAVPIAISTTLLVAALPLALRFAALLVTVAPIASLFTILLVAVLRGAL